MITSGQQVVRKHQLSGLLKPEIFPLAVASLCFVEGVHTHYNQNVGIVLAIPIQSLGNTESTLIFLECADQ